MSKDLSLELLSRNFSLLTSEQTEAISVAIPILLVHVLAEVSCPELVSGNCGIRKGFGEGLSKWALLDPSWLNSEGGVPTRILKLVVELVLDFSRIIGPRSAELVVSLCNLSFFLGVAVGSEGALRCHIKLPRSECHCT